MELCKREGEAASTKIKTLIHAYVEEHEPGNPQLPIWRFIEGVHLKPFCPLFRRGECPTHPHLCVQKKRYRCIYTLPAAELKEAQAQGLAEQPPQHRVFG